MFTHLHVHTGYSILDGHSRIDKLVNKAKEMGQSALAITDHGYMYGVIPFYNACTKNGIKPILGVELYTTEDIPISRPKIAMPAISFCSQKTSRAISTF